MAQQSPPFALQNASHSAALFRQALTSLFSSGGPSDATSYVVSAQSTPNMSVQVAGGQAWIDGTSVSNVSGQSFSTQGFYYALNDAPVTLTIAAADATNPRIDLVYLQVNDSFYSGTNNNAVLGVVTGTPASTPAVPSTPSNALALAKVAVAANATQITNSNITAVSTGLAASATVRGSAIICTSTTRPLSPVDGQPIFETNTRAYGYYEQSSGKWIMFDNQWQTYTPVLSTSAYNNTWNAGNATVIGRYFRNGRLVNVECHLILGSTTTYGTGGTGAILVSPPSGYYPYSWAASASGWSIPTPSQAVVANGASAVGTVAISNSATPSQRRFAFYNSSDAQLTGAAGSAGSWNLWASTQGLIFACCYETNFEA